MLVCPGKGPFLGLTRQTAGALSYKTDKFINAQMNSQRYAKSKQPNKTVQHHLLDDMFLPCNISLKTFSQDFYVKISKVKNTKAAFLNQVWIKYPYSVSCTKLNVSKSSEFVEIIAPHL